MKICRACILSRWQIRSCCYLWLPFSICIRFVSCLLLGLIQIINALWQVLSCSMFMRHFVWLGEHLLDHCSLTSFGAKIEWRPAIMPWTYASVTRTPSEACLQPAREQLSYFKWQRRKQESIVNFKAAESSMVSRKRPIFCISLGENTVIVAAFVVFMYHENKLFLRHFWLGHLVGKTRDEREEKEMSRGLWVPGHVLCVYTHQVGRGRETATEKKIKSLWKVGEKQAEKEKT